MKMNNWMKKVSALAVAGVMALSMTACGLVPCQECGGSGTKGYKSPEGKVYFCDDCASDCAFCGDDATCCYESLFGTIFVCKDCYEYILDLND